MVTSPNRIAGERTESVCDVHPDFLFSGLGGGSAHTAVLCSAGAFPGQPLGSHALGGRGPLSALGGGSFFLFFNECCE